MGVKVKIKKLHPDAVIPKLATAGSACVDVVATKVYLLSENKAVVHLGFALEIPVGYKVCLAPRSSFTKTNWVMQNSPAQIDSDYRGEVMLRFTAIPTEVTIMDEDELEDARSKFLGADEEQRAETEFEQDFLESMSEDDEEIFDESDLLSEYVGFLEYDEFPYKEGDRCAQMWIEKVQRIEFEEADELEDTERGDGGFGSTGN